MTPRDPKYAPNPERSIYVQGFIDHELVYRLTPQILKLQNQDTAPITVYIDSPGGVTTDMQSLLRLLRVSQNVDEANHFITVVTSSAASAAADLLATGNYALAYRDSAVLFHGVRVSGDRILTVEETLQLAQRLKAGNESYAMQLAREAEFRAIFRFITLKDQFADMRAANPELTDLQCLIKIVSEKLSSSAIEVLGKALKRHARYNSLLQYVATHAKHPSTYKTIAKGEAAQIKAIIDFECSQNKPNKEWSFLSEGMNRLSDDFFLFHEYIRMFQSPRFQRLCDIFEESLLTPEEEKEIEKLPKEDRPKKIAETVRPKLQPIWSFFVALCHVLQQGENQLTGLDAFWLGLVDEIVGVTNLPSFRLWMEHSQQIAKDEQDKAKAEKAAAPNAAEAAAGA